MSMPPPRFLGMGVGCVVKYSAPPGGPPTLIIAATIKDIMSLDPAFFTVAKATQIYNYQLDIDPGPVAAATKYLFTDQAVSVISNRFQVQSHATTKKAKKAKKAKAKYKGLPPSKAMVDGYCYWLEPLKVKKSKKKRARKRK
jgi:hypothetical protein